MMKITNPINGEIIVTIDEWAKIAKPEHWVDGYSAKETAKFWLQQKEFPQEILNRLKYIEGIENFNADILTPELQTTFDKYRNGRNHDVGVYGKSGNKKIFIGIESKVAEPFDNKTVGQYLQLGMMKRWKNISTEMPERVEGLCKMFRDYKKIDFIFDLKYQLIQATAGVVAEA